MSKDVRLLLDAIVEERKNVRNQIMVEVDEWLDATGAIDKASSWYAELKFLILEGERRCDTQ